MDREVASCKEGGLTMPLKAGRPQTAAHRLTARCWTHPRGSSGDDEMITPPLAKKAEDVSAEVRRGLARLYKLRLWLWGTWLAFLPFMAIVMAVRPPEWLLTPLGIFWFSTWGVLVVVHGLYRCPACRRCFNWSWYSKPFTSKCLHCGISIGLRERGVQQGVGPDDRSPSAPARRSTP